LILVLSSFDFVIPKISDNYHNFRITNDARFASRFKQPVVQNFQILILLFRCLTSKKIIDHMSCGDFRHPNVDLDMFADL
jgi:hypothetical protein